MFRRFVGRLIDVVLKVGAGPLAVAYGLGFLTAWLF
jgi:hypothetical protein